MSLTASTLMTAAKQRAFPAIGTQRVSDAMLLSELSYQDTLIVQMFSQIAPDLLATVTGTDTVTLSENQSGYTLTSGIHYRDFTHVDADNNYTPITLVHRDAIDVPPRQPAGTIRISTNSGIFYPADPQGERWQTSGTREWFEEDESHSFTYSYVPLPGQITSRTATLVSPDMARETLIAALVVALMISSPKATEAQVQEAVQRYTASIASLRMQAYKFTHPAGTRRGQSEGMTESEWVAEQVGS